MVVLTAITAALYAAVLIPFKPITIIPGITELRPGVVVPMICSFFFGPAAAWGAGIGNVIGDVFGAMFGPASSFGFIGNVLLAFLPYKLWMAFTDSEPIPRNLRLIVLYMFVVLVASAACALTCGAGVEFFGFFPFVSVAVIIVVNNFLCAAVLGPILLPVLYPRVKRLGLLYRDVMHGEIRRGKLYPLGVVIVTASVCCGLVGGAYLSKRSGASGGDLKMLYAGQSGDRLCVAIEVHGQPSGDYDYAVEVSTGKTRYLIVLPADLKKEPWMVRGETLNAAVSSGTPVPAIKRGVDGVIWAEIPREVIGSPANMSVRAFTKCASDGRVKDDFGDGWLAVSIPERFSSAAELPRVRGAAKLPDAASDYVGASRIKSFLALALLATMVGAILL